MKGQKAAVRAKLRAVDLGDRVLSDADMDAIWILYQRKRSTDRKQVERLYAAHVWELSTTLVKLRSNCLAKNPASDEYIMSGTAFREIKRKLRTAAAAKLGAVPAADIDNFISHCQRVLSRKRH